jgi:TetR/AcrR family transcriptional regulator, cholesterol catabolism regulator
MPAAQDARTRILQAAADLFMENGFGGTSVREIGERAGVGQSSLYHHVRSKGQLLQELHHNFARELIAALEAATSPDGSVAGQLREIVRAVLKIVQTHQAGVTVFLRERHSLPPEAREPVQLERDQVDAIIDGVIQRGIDEGEFRADLDVVLARLALLGMCNWTYEWYRADGARTISEISDYFADFALNGMMARRD